MFLFKKIVAPFLFPLPLCLALLAAGLFFLWCTGRQRIGKVLVTFGTILLLLFSYGVGSDTLLEHLETRFPPLLHAADSSPSAPKPFPPAPRWILVLGGGHISDPRIPEESWLYYATLVRLVEGIALYRETPGSKLLLSGGAVFDPVPEARVMAEVATRLGVPRNDLVLDEESKDTEDQAKIIKSLIDDVPAILVTSAAHMPRAMALFEKQGMHHLLPAPAGHFIRGETGLAPGIFFPDPARLARATTAFYEWLGLAWMSLRAAL